MTLLVLGLALWVIAHLVKRLAPEARAGLTARLGPGASRGLFAVAIAAGLALMILGYRAAPYVAVYTPPFWGIHLNNTLMLIAVYLFGASHSKARVRLFLRNPMLTGVMLWAVAHLLVNGDLASVILFGGLGIWAAVNALLINAAGPWVKIVPGPAKVEIRLVFITLLVFAVITSIHAWLGVWPFPG